MEPEQAQAEQGELTAQVGNEELPEVPAVRPPDAQDATVPDEPHEPAVGIPDVSQPAAPPVGEPSEGVEIPIPGRSQPPPQ